MSAPAPFPHAEDFLERDLAQLLQDRLLGAGAGIGPVSNLYDAGLDSMALMQLLVLLEQEYAVTVADSDISKEHFSSVRNLACFVRARRRQGAARV